MKHYVAFSYRFCLADGEKGSGYTSLFFLWLCWVFIAVWVFSINSCGEQGGYSLLQCTGFSLRWLLLLQSTGSRHLGFISCWVWTLECRLSSCGTQALLLLGMWDLPKPGTEPVSPVLAGRFLTTGQPGKSKGTSLKAEDQGLGGGHSNLVQLVQARWARVESLCPEPVREVRRMRAASCRTRQIPGAMIYPQGGQLGV